MATKAKVSGAEAPLGESLVILPILNKRYGNI
jgi:hypothetical protein